MVDPRRCIRKRLGSVHGRTHRAARRTSRPRARSCSGSCWTHPGRCGCEDEAPLSVTAVVRGHLWVCPDGEEPVRLEAGDVVVWVGSDHWTIADDPGTADPDRDPPRPGLHHRRRSRRGRGDEPGRAQLGQQQRRRDRAPDRRLPAGGRGHPAAGPGPAAHAWCCAPTSSTPRCSTCSARRWSATPRARRRCSTGCSTCCSSRCCAPGSTRPQSDAPAWYAAQGDAVVGPALRLMQHHPEHPWTVAELADRAGVSRAAFAKRFTELVGEPPMAFLTDWRITLAADLLLEPDVTVASVARQVGYATPVRAERGVQARAGDQPARPPTGRGSARERPPDGAAGEDAAAEEGPLERVVAVHAATAEAGDLARGVQTRERRHRPPPRTGRRGWSRARRASCGTGC